MSSEKGNREDLSVYLGDSSYFSRCVSTALSVLQLRSSTESDCHCAAIRGAGSEVFREEDEKRGGKIEDACKGRKLIKNSSYAQS